MKSKAPITTCLAVLLAGMAISCKSHKATREMDEGKKDYRAGNYSGAIDHFKTAAGLDDDSIPAKFALASAYAAQCVPGIDTAENRQYCQQAIDIFLKILERDPQNKNALRDIGVMSWYMQRFDQSREYFKKAVAAGPDDFALHYSLGVVDWAITYKIAAELKANAGLRVDDDIKTNLKLCKDLQAGNQELVDEGLGAMQKAVELQKDSDDAMAYMWLLYRRKADVDCNNPQARLEDLRISRKWFDVGVAARRQRSLNQLPSDAKNPGEADDGLETGNTALLTLLPPAPPPPPPDQTTRQLH